MTGNSTKGGLNLIQQKESGDGCWSCGAMRAAHYCQSCGKVQPPRPVNYFTFFGLPRKLNLDVAALERDFYRLSRKLHPDTSVNATADEQGWSLEQSSHLNDAYRTLKDPVTRTEYLLHLEGAAMEEQSQAATEKARASGQLKKQIVPPELLEEVFELNMQLEELRAAKTLGEVDASLIRDLGQQKQHLESMLSKVDAELRARWSDWDARIEHGATGEAQIAVRDRMVDILNRRNYLRNLVRDVNEALG